MDDNVKKIKKIKEMFIVLDPAHKKTAKKKITEKFKVAESSVNNRWIYKGEIPEKYIDETLKIVKSVVKTQKNKIEKLIA
ncbi:hypothetical protein [Chryseobacterium sp.]|jgi:hypothetical protein|uniref:hypothetical protein n=1 Tax=Chryseobacterium sp. TaxID=1871047 RepID=UPI0028516BD4|nr:hypothetical protein [Chryseobacterium sp.]MDR3026010.1 hypothetical protein [Chryseobacterium sp.]